MDTKIKFNAKLLTKAIWVLISIGIFLSVVIFLSLEIDLTYSYMLSMLIVFAGILIVFFINRNEPESIEIKEEKIQIAYFNKVFFKKKPVSYIREELIANINNNDIIKLFKGDELIVIIRKEAIKIDDWKQLKTFLIA